MPNPDIAYQNMSADTLYTQMVTKAQAHREAQGRAYEPDAQALEKWLPTDEGQKLYALHRHKTVHGTTGVPKRVDKSPPAVPETWSALTPGDFQQRIQKAAAEAGQTVGRFFQHTPQAYEEYRRKANGWTTPPAVQQRASDPEAWLAAKVHQDQAEAQEVAVLAKTADPATFRRMVIQKARTMPALVDVAHWPEAELLDVLWSIKPGWHALAHARGLA